MQSKTFKRKNNKSKKSKRFIQNSKKRSNIKKMIGGLVKAFILIDDLLAKKNNVFEARDYQADALEKTINNYTTKSQSMMEHSYYDGTIKFSIIKVNTKLVEIPNLDYEEQLSLYILKREDGSSSYISQNKNALMKLI